MKNFLNFNYYCSAESNVLKPLNFFNIYNLGIYLTIFLLLCFLAPKGFYNSIDKKTTNYASAGIFSIYFGFYIILAFVILLKVVYC
jgi:hypothetical protein